LNSWWVQHLPKPLRRFLDGRPTLQKAAANTGWLFGDRILRMIASVLVGAWVARHLGPEDYGTLNYAVAFVSLFSAFATLGLDSIVVRDLVLDPSQEGSLMGTSFVLRSVGGISVVLLATGAAILRRGLGQDALLVMLSALPLVLGGMDAIDFWFQAHVRSKYVVYARNLAFLGLTLTRVALIFSNAPLWAWAAIGSAEALVATLGLAWYYRQQGGHMKAWHFKAPLAWRILRDSWPFAASTVANYWLLRLDQVMIGNSLPREQLGYYSTAVRMNEMLFMLPGIIMGSLFPKMIEDFRVDSARARYNLVRSTRILAIVGAALVGCLWFVGGPTILLLFGQRYAGAIPMLMVLNLTLWVVFLSAFRPLYVRIHDLQVYNLVNIVVGTLVNIGLNLIWIPRYGALGACWATLIAHIACNYAFDRLWEPARVMARIQEAALFGGEA
jgi:O-antigen/teichoic acid export membrane protein